MWIQPLPDCPDAAGAWSCQLAAILFLLPTNGDTTNKLDYEPRV